VTEEEEYKPFFQLLDETRTATMKERLKKNMKAEGLVGEYLDHRNALVPGKPGRAFCHALLYTSDNHLLISRHEGSALCCAPHSSKSVSTYPRKG
jgi:hypothetical protein